MDAIRQYAKNPLLTGIVGLVVGMILGLVVLGWWLWPVEWTQATPAQLSQEWKTEFIRMAVAGFSQNGDQLQAQERFKAVGDGADEILASIRQDPLGLNEAVIAEYQGIVGVSETAAVPPAEAEEEAEGSGGGLTILLIALIVLLVVLFAFLAYMFFVRKRMALPGAAAPAQHTAEVQHQTGSTDYASTGDDTPIAQFMASFKLGDDLFDDSFSIDSASGEFLGECGVGISETIGVGDHKKVTAFEVWLFDKNDIQTVTKVLMSGHAYNDPAIRQRLEAKGEPILLEPGIETVLETQSLQLVARVVDIHYGNGSMPDESYFDQMLMELAIWTKAV
jgi:hypothetical protein